MTPHHIANLFCKIADLTCEDKVLDICTGTGAFLISAMKYEIDKIRTEDSDEREKIISSIKAKNFYGIEQQRNMFALACSNMILRNDGKSHLYLGSCFDFIGTSRDKTEIEKAHAMLA